MNYNMLTDTLEQDEGWGQIDALSVYRAMEQVQDGRHKRGVRYPVALILTLIVLGKMAGMTMPAAIAEWVRRLSGVAEPDLAGEPPELSLRGDLQQCAARTGCRASQ